jgi:enterochelin esterase-like enzyme
MSERLAPHSNASLAWRVVLAAAIVALAVLLDRTVLDDSPADGELRGSTVREIVIDSRALAREMPATVVIPPGPREGSRALVVFLHGRGSDQPLHPEMTDALIRQGGKAPILALPGGGGDSYWHDREAGPYGTYVLDELIPRLVRRFGVDPGRVAIAGISMGGFGAFNLARQQPDRFCSVAGHSPAVWEAAEDTAPGAFDDAEDFARNDVLTAVAAEPGPLEGMRTWVDVGEDDPFAPAATKLYEALEASGARASYRLWPGGHETDYWRGNWRAYARFYAETLAECGREGEGGGGRPG